MLFFISLLNHFLLGNFMKFTIICIISAFFNLTGFAQKENFTIEDVAINSYTKLSAEKVKQASWIGETEFVGYVKNNRIIIANANSGEKSEIISLKELNSELSKLGIDSVLLEIPELNWININTALIWIDHNLISIKIDPVTIELKNKLEISSANQTFSPDYKSVAYTFENNLFLSDEKSKITQITNEKDNNIVSGQFVSRNEFGSKSGIFWSPKSNFLAFYQKDESGVSDFPILEMGTTPAKIKNIKYPMAGQTSEILSIGIYSIKNKNTVWLDAGENKEQYLTNVSWDPSEKFIYVAHLNRDQNHLKLIKYDVVSGKQIKVLFEEIHDKYIEPHNKLKFLSGEQFIWFSERDNWQHLYLYKSNGDLIKQLTSGNWIVKELIGLNKTENEVYFTGTKETIIEDQLYCLNINTGKIERVTELNLHHTLLYNNYNKLFLDTYTSLEIPSVTQVIDVKGKSISKLEIIKNPVADYKISKPEIFKLKGKNQIDLYSSIILPTDFDSTKTYPAIIYVYGGPHSQLITNEWYHGKYDFWFQYMSQKSYIIFQLDNRGTDNRGLEFEQATFRRLGTVELEDQLTGLKYLKSLKYVDTTRIGIYGWSYGGFMTTTMMLRTDNIFKVGVAGGPVIDWKYYEAMYGERYMDTPQNNPDGYEEASLLNYIDNLDAKLLIIHGTSDPTVVWQNSLEFIKKTVSLNKKLDFFPYIGHLHHVKGNDMINLYQKITDYFLDNL